MKRSLPFTAFVLLFASAVSARAGTVVYTGPSSEKLMVQSAPDAGKNVYYIKFTGISSAWADHVIKTKQINAATGNRYQFDYEVALSSGNIKKTYQILVDDGYELKNGSRVPKIQLFTKDMPNHGQPYELDYDAALSKSNDYNLSKEFEKSPFKPDLD